MDWMQYTRFLASLVFVLGLILAGLWAVRRLGLVQAGLGGGARRRLSVVESLPIDNRRRLVLVRRDDMEYVILLGGGTDLVVESRKWEEAQE